MGVTKDTIRIVLFLGTHDQQNVGAEPTRWFRARGPRDEPAGLHRGVVRRLAGGARPQLQPVGPQVRVRRRQPDRARRGRATRRRPQRRREGSVRRREQRSRHRGRRSGVRGRARGEEDHRLLRRDHEHGSRPAGAVPLPRRVRQQRRRHELGDLRRPVSSRARPRSGRATSPPRSACSARSTPRPGIDWEFFESTPRRKA